MDNSLEEMEERLIPEASESQRRTMKNVNDLALMLSESMENMQQQMASMMGGGQMCTKPGGQGMGKDGNVPMDKITEGQQGMGDQLKEMQENNLIFNVFSHSGVSVYVFQDILLTEDMESIVKQFIIYGEMSIEDIYAATNWEEERVNTTLHQLWDLSILKMKEDEKYFIPGLFNTQ